MTPYRTPAPPAPARPVSWIRRFVRSPARIVSATLASFALSWAVAIVVGPLGYPDLALALFMYPLHVVLFVCAIALIRLAWEGLRDWIAAEDAEREGRLK